MKAIELIKKVQEIIDKHGENIEVFVSTYHSGNYSLDSVSDYVGVDVLSDFPESKIFEHHGNEDDPDGPGLIYGIKLYGRNLVEKYKG